jgi:hypothetical protein
MERRAPVEQLSLESMNRMIDVGLDLHYEGGSPGNHRRLNIQD